MPSCSAIDCQNRSSNIDWNGSFHRLPEVEKDIWLLFIKRKDGDKLKDLRICSEHFEPDCFERDLKAELMGTKPKHTLKANSIPTIFSFKKLSEKRKSSEARESTSTKKQLISDAILTTPEQRFVKNPEVKKFRTFGT